MKGIQLVALCLVLAVAIILVASQSADAGYGCGYGYGFSSYYPVYNNYVFPVHTCVPRYIDPCYHSFHRCW